MQSEAVQLFVERARNAAPGWKPSASALGTIGEICRRLEGMPLAIELLQQRHRERLPKSEYWNAWRTIWFARSGAAMCVR